MKKVIQNEIKYLELLDIIKKSIKDRGALEVKKDKVI